MENSLFLPLGEFFGLAATEYEREISIGHLVRARANLPELEAFLIDIGWG